MLVSLNVILQKKKEIEKKLKNINFNYIINLGGYIDHRKKLRLLHHIFMVQKI